MVGSIVVIGALFHPVCDLKAALINMQYSLIQELILCKFKLGHNATVATENIYCIKGEGAIDQMFEEILFKPKEPQQLDKVR